MNSKDVEWLLTCPISLERMQDPVVLYPSGNSYDRQHICESLLHYPGLDPKSGRNYAGPLVMAPNYALRNILLQQQEQEEKNNNDNDDKTYYVPYDDTKFQEAYWRLWQHKRDMEQARERLGLVNDNTDDDDAAAAHPRDGGVGGNGRNNDDNDDNNDNNNHPTNRWPQRNEQDLSATTNGGRVVRDTIAAFSSRISNRFGLIDYECLPGEVASFVDFLQQIHGNRRRLLQPGHPLLMLIRNRRNNVQHMFMIGGRPINDIYVGSGDMGRLPQILREGRFKIAFAMNSAIQEMNCNENRWYQDPGNSRVMIEGRAVEHFQEGMAIRVANTFVIGAVALADAGHDIIQDDPVGDIARFWDFHLVHPRVYNQDTLVQRLETRILNSANPDLSFYNRRALSEDEIAGRGLKFVVGMIAIMYMPWPSFSNSSAKTQRYASESTFQKTMEMATNGDANAQSKLGWLYLHGFIGNEGPDCKTALQWYEKAAATRNDVTATASRMAEKQGSEEHDPLSFSAAAAAAAVVLDVTCPPLNAFDTGLC